MQRVCKRTIIRHIYFQNLAQVLTKAAEKNGLLDYAKIRDILKVDPTNVTVASKIPISDSHYIWIIF